MASSRLLFGGVNDYTLHIGASGFPGTGVTTFIRFNADTDNASRILSSVAYNNYNELSNIRVGQFVYGTGLGFTNNRSKITAIDLGNSQITIEDIPSSTLSSKLFAVQLPKGQIFVESGSITSPTNAGLSFVNITGSSDSEYQAGDTEWGVFAEVAATSSISSKVSSKFAQYQVHEVVQRSSNTRASFYLTASSEGILQEPAGETFSSTNQGVAIFEFSKTSSLGPMFASVAIDGSQVNEASGFAAYLVSVQDLFDRVNTGSAGFPFTGSANISGSLEIDGSTGERNDFFIVKNNTFTAFKVSSSNVTVFGDIQGTRPVAVGGGMIYSASNFYAGID